MKTYRCLVFVLATATLAVSFEDQRWDFDLSDIQFDDFLPEPFKVDSNRIIGGEVAVPGQFAYQAGLRMNKSTTSSWCGGVLVSNEYVLTAAHCAINALFIDVYLGAQELKNLTEGGRVNVRVPAENIVVHKAYNPSQISNDIAILRLPEPVNVTDQIRPVALPSYSDVLTDFAGQAVIISGWGKDANNATTVTDFLRFVGVTVQPQDVCKYFFGSVRTSNICTETATGRGTCNGDSGGPMVLNRSSGPVLLGLTSFGSSRGCVACWPSVFVRVSYYLDWIASNSNIEIKV